jgi:resolvase-like protein
VLIGVRPARPLPALSATFLLVRIYDFSIRERHNRALDQNLALQRDALTEARCAEIFTEQMSGAVTDRPALHDALEFARSGDTLIVWKLDRLARSMKQLIETVEILRVRGIGFRGLTEALDTTTARGRLVFHMFGALAEFDRSLIRERTQAGLAAARRIGRTGGRRSKLTDEDIEAGQSRHRRDANRAPPWRVAGGALSVHTGRANREYPRRLTKTDPPWVASSRPVVDPEPSFMAAPVGYRVGQAAAIRICLSRR